MMEMVNVSRLSNAMRAAGIMRRSVLESVVHARGRSAFGRALAELPLLQRDLLEMLLDAEAGCSVILNAAAMLDRADAGSAADRALVRIVTPLAKYWLTARARVVAGEAMNVRGGNGYIEEWVNARLVRDAYLGAIWEGSTNVVALDVQRAILRDAGFRRWPGSSGPARHGRRAARQALGGRGGRHARGAPAARGRLAGPRRRRSASSTRVPWPTRSTTRWPARCCSRRARPCGSSAGAPASWRRRRSI